MWSLVQKIIWSRIHLEWRVIFQAHSPILNYNGSYYICDISTTRPIIKFTTKAEFDDKIKIRNLVGAKSLSRLFIQKSGFTMKRKWHLNKCCRRRLIPYIRYNYNISNYVFWLDLTRSHYCKIVSFHFRQKLSWGSLTTRLASQLTSTNWVFFRHIWVQSVCLRVGSRQYPEIWWIELSTVSKLWTYICTTSSKYQQN